MSTMKRPEGWLDGEIELTAFALAHPDCDVRAVLGGFAAWIQSDPKFSAPKPTPEPTPALERLIETWQQRACACASRQYNAQTWEAIGIEIRRCASELQALVAASVSSDSTPAIPTLTTCICNPEQDIWCAMHYSSRNGQTPTIAKEP